MKQTRRISIIGAGFSGVVTAVHLLRSESGPCTVTLINRSGRMARGVAYGTNSPAHMLNVPAGRMSAFADDEESFLRFARQRDPNVTGGSFVSRSLYGDYLDSILELAEATAPRGTILERVVGHVWDIQPDADRSTASIILEDGRSIIADRIVLAFGNSAPVNPPITDRSFFSSSLYIRDPWAHGAMDEIGADEEILLIGTGLTMFDIVLDLRSRGLRRTIHALSRRGMLAQSHRPHGHAPTYENFPPGLDSGNATVLAYLRAVRSEIASHAAQGGDWRDVIASLRPSTPALWESLTDRERARFIRHVRPFWEIHRHRAAPEAADATRQLIEDGTLVVAAGRLLELSEVDGKVACTWRPRGSDSVVTRTFTRVINCTGPASDLGALREPLLDALIERGNLVADPLRLGVNVSENGTLLSRDGTASKILFYVGPLLKARYWEATAVPELRVHAARLAQALHASFMDDRENRRSKSISDDTELETAKAE